jgi:hypothetical protein
MSDLTLLRMPEHHVPDVQGQTLCRASRVPGYAHMMDDEKFGHLHCNRCGYVTPEQVVLTYSPSTDRHYLTWDDLTSAEANGYVVIGTSTRRNTVPVVVGPFDTKDEAKRAAARLRRKWKREEDREHGPGYSISAWVRPLWKDER